MKTMAEVICSHVADWTTWGDNPEGSDYYTCSCSEVRWHVNTSADYYQAHAEHQAAALTAAGYGPVKEAAAGALRDAAKSRDESKDLMRFTWGQRIWLHNRAKAIEAEP